METIIYKGHKIEISPDESPESPREWDNMSQLICFHNRYDLGDKHEYDHSDYPGWEEMKMAIIRAERPYIIMPLYLYDHSGITISMTPFGCQWDSGQIGFVIVSKETISDFYTWQRVTARRKIDLMKYLKAEVDMYDQFIRGNIYCFNIEGPDGEDVDSCSGFYGEKAALEDAESIIDFKLKGTEDDSAERNNRQLQED